MASFSKVVVAVKNSPMPEAQKVACLAQAILESGRGTSSLFKTCKNPFGIKYRTELAGIAKPFAIQVPSESGVVEFAKFETEEDAVKGYELFIKRVPYIGYKDHLGSPEEYINFIGRIYAGDPNYSRKVISLFDEAELYLDAVVSAPAPIPESKPTGVITEKWARLLKTDKLYYTGLTQLRFQIWGLVDGLAKLLVDIPAVSGLGRTQVFQTASVSPSGSFRPLGEGYYTVGRVEWAGGKDNWKTPWRDNGNGLGPIWQTITCLSKTPRTALGVHLDWNAATAPGTAGCIGILNIDDAKKYLEFSGAMPLTVNWNLGTVETKGFGPRGASVSTAPVQPKPPVVVPEPEVPEDEEEEEEDSQATLKGVKIALDVGHGYFEGNTRFDPGATNKTIREWDLNMQAAKIIESRLERLGATVNVFSYEEKGSGTTLGNKGRKAKGHDIFISIHHNAAVATAQGTEVFTEDSHFTMEDTELASMILAGMVKQNGLRNRGVKAMGLGVLTGAHNLCRAKCLTESFFISHNQMTPELAKTLAEKSAIGICDGIIRYVVENKISRA